MTRRFIIVAAVLTGAWCLVGAASCSNTGGTPAGAGAADTGSAAASGSPAQAAPPVAIGARMHAQSGDSVTATALNLSYSSGNEFETASAGHQCIQVTVALNNGSQSEWTLPLSEVSVVDGAGQKYDSFGGNCGSGDSIDSLVVGGHAAAKLVFEVPANSPLNLTWVPDQFGPEVYQTKLR
jgi:hypothetical protein